MFKRLWTIFARDMKVGTRDFITLLVLLFPLVFALGINLITPGTTTQPSMWRWSPARTRTGRPISTASPI